ncbi:MAG TPA: hypothetical protein VMP67_10115 [Candidatus Limnocylindria bacterium]|nr:hypothetical protein [Candidatus Limnocylindria bacterium]
MQLVSIEVEAVPVGNIEEMLQKRRIARDQVAIARSKVTKRREDLVEVRACRLDEPVSVHAQAHVEAGRPSAHRESVDRDQRAGSERIAREETDVPMGD